jgi:hypothetical protein
MRRVRSISAKTLFARLPVVAWTCVVVAVLNAAAWSLITPPFQGRDEQDHFAYVQQLAETHTLPHSTQSRRRSEEEELVLAALDHSRVRLKPQIPAISSVGQQRVLNQALEAEASRTGSGSAGVATSEPPLFYALETIPYAIGQGNILVQLQLMRLLGALMAGITTLLTFLFLRELLSGTPQAVAAGTLCVALQPLFGFMSGTLNPDTMLYAIAAALFLCLARGFRRGLTRPLAIAMGLLIAVGFATKLNFVGLAFGVFAGLVVLSIRQMRSNRREASLSLAIAAVIGCAPLVLYVLANLLSGHATLGLVSADISIFLKRSIFDQVSYVWELYLPRLPGMTHYFEGISTTWNIWFERSVGLYGWIDTMFPVWVSRIALLPASVVTLLCARALILQRTVLRSRLPEIAVYALMTVGVLVMVGIASYNSDVLEHIEAYGDPRYLLPMLPLLGAVLVLAIRGAGRRFGASTAVVLVFVFLTHDIFSQLQVVARYYG